MRIKRLNLKTIVIPICIIITLGTFLVGIVINAIAFANMPNIMIGSYRPSFWEKLKDFLDLYLNDIFGYLMLGILLSFIVVVIVSVYNFVAKFFGRSAIDRD